MAPRPQDLVVKPRIDPSPDLLELAAWQAGVLTSRQAGDFGLGRHSVTRLLEAQRWLRLDRGIFFVREGPPPWEALAWAGVLLGGSDARIGGGGAGYLHGLLDTAPSRVPVLIPQSRILVSRGPWDFRRERPGVRSARTLGSPPRLSVEDTVLDLCQRADTEGVIHLVTKAVQCLLTTVPRLRQALASRQQTRHRRLIENLLADVAEGAETPLEITYLKRVERAHRLPRGSRQQSSGSSGYLRDVRYDEFQLVVELDGRLGHEGMGRFRDMRRDNATTANGEATLRYGSADVYRRACRVAEQVATVLTLQGWTGQLRKCPQCA